MNLCLKTLACVVAFTFVGHAYSRDACVVRTELEDCYSTMDETTCMQKDLNMRSVTKMAYGCLWVSEPRWTGGDQKYCGIISTGHNNAAECYQLSLDQCELFAHCRIYRPEDISPI